MPWRAKLGVAPASVTNMLQKLAAGSPPLVEYERHRGVLLSSAGKKRALEVVRHHRLIETFLYEVLDYPIDEVHEEAERLEHFISERFEERIDAKLGHPKIDPHGHCIPAMDGAMPRQNSIVLTDAMNEGTYVVDSVSDRDAAHVETTEGKRHRTWCQASGERETFDHELRSVRRSLFRDCEPSGRGCE